MQVLKLPIWAIAALLRHSLHTSDFCLCKLSFGGFSFSCADISIIWVQNAALGWEVCSWLVMACPPFYSCSRKLLVIRYSLFSKPCVRGPLCWTSFRYLRGLCPWSVPCMYREFILPYAEQYSTMGIYLILLNSWWIVENFSNFWSLPIIWCTYPYTFCVAICFHAF